MTLFGTEIEDEDLRVLVCGSRNWAYEGPPVYTLERPLFSLGSPDAQMINDVLRGLFMRRGLDHLTLIEGGATGADSVAWWWAERILDNCRDTDTDILEHLHFPADWSLGKKAGYVRNAQMLKEGKPNLVLAFTHDYEASRGTKMMVELAEKAGVRTYVIG